MTDRPGPETLHAVLARFRRALLARVLKESGIRPQREYWQTIDLRAPLQELFLEARVSASRTLRGRIGRVLGKLWGREPGK